METSRLRSELKRANVHLPFLDAMRGIAILLVFLFHALFASYGYDALPWKGWIRDFDTTPSFLWLYPLTYGMSGVAIFFAISGFCIHLSHSRSKSKRWSDFFARRFFRIYPPYLLALAIFVFVWPGGWFDLESKKKMTQVITHFFSVHNYGHKTFYGINPSFWSIAVELQLYLIYPILWWVSQRFSWKHSLWMGAAFEITLRTVQSYYGLISDEKLPRYLTDSPFSYWFSWAMGAYLCECYLKGKRSRLFSIRFDVLLVICLLLPVFKPTNLFVFASFSWLCCVSIQRLITGQWRVERWQNTQNQVLRWSWAHLSFLGLVSYSFYLLHQPFFVRFQKYTKWKLEGMEYDPIWLFVVCLGFYPFVLGLSYLFYKYVELPSIGLGKKVLSLKPRGPKISQ